MTDNTLENHLLLSTSLLEHFLLSYSQNTNDGGSLHEATAGLVLSSKYSDLGRSICCLKQFYLSLVILFIDSNHYWLESRSSLTQVILQIGQPE